MTARLFFRIRLHSSGVYVRRQILRRDHNCHDVGFHNGTLPHIDQEFRTFHVLLRRQEQCCSRAVPPRSGKASFTLTRQCLSPLSGQLHKFNISVDHNGILLSLCAHGTFILLLPPQADYKQPAPFFLLAGLTAICALVLRLSPETLGKPLPDSMIEANLIGRQDRVAKPGV